MNRARRVGALTAVLAAFLRLALLLARRWLERPKPIGHALNGELAAALARTNPKRNTAVADDQACTSLLDYKPVSGERVMYRLPGFGFAHCRRNLTRDVGR